MSDRPRITVLIDHYLPGPNFGGPTVSVANMIFQLNSDYEFTILTSDRDHLASIPYSSAEMDGAEQLSGCQIIYKRLPWSPRIIAKEVEATRPDVVYLSSLFSRRTLAYLVGRRLGRGTSDHTVVAPRGELLSGAIDVRRTRKQFFLAIARHAGLFTGLNWHATSEFEAEAIIDATAAPRASVHIAANIPSDPKSLRSFAGTRPPKAAGDVRLVFISRVSMKKNLHFLIRLLAEVQGTVHLDVVGPGEPDAMELALNEAAALGERASVSFRGPQTREGVANYLSQAHFFCLPTKSENYGHAIAEALQVGVPVIITDRTPWTDIQETGGGFVIPHSNASGWTWAIQRCADMGEREYGEMSNSAQEYARRRIVSSNAVCEHIDMFSQVLDLTR